MTTIKQAELIRREQETQPSEGVNVPARESQPNHKQLLDLLKEKALIFKHLEKKGLVNSEVEGIKEQLAGLIKELEALNV